MRKILSGSLLLLACTLLVACGPKEPTKKPPVEEEEAAETVVEVERWWQLNSTNPDTPAEQRLHCEYSKVVDTPDGPMVARADVRTSGSCDFKALAGKAGDPAKKFPRENFKNILTVMSGPNFDASSAKKPKWDCSTMKVTTSKDRTLWAQDCQLRQEPANIADPMANTPSASAESAAYRLNKLIGPVKTEPGM